jgi:hypothetical protein
VETFVLIRSHVNMCVAGVYSNEGVGGWVVFVLLVIFVIGAHGAAFGMMMMGARRCMDRDQSAGSTGQGWAGLGRLRP